MGGPEAPHSFFLRSTLPVPPSKANLKLPLVVLQTSRAVTGFRNSKKAVSAVGGIPLTTIAALGYKHPILKPPLKVLGAPISDQDAKTIVEYLASAYGPTK